MEHQFAAMEQCGTDIVVMFMEMSLEIFTNSLTAPNRRKLVTSLLSTALSDCLFFSCRSFHGYVVYGQTLEARGRGLPLVNDYTEIDEFREKTTK
jgi:hypothetical protein